MRKTYGNTWWGQQWLNALSNIDFSNRLPRGRTYANKGLARDIVIKGNKITAKVQGTRATPYKVRFTIPPFSKDQKSSIIELVTSANPLFLSQLLNRELPAELKDACSKKGIELFAKEWNDLQGSCSCPDWAVPCKHMASVLYLIANEIDKNPFLVFQLHNFDLFEELEKIGYTAQGQKEIAITALSALWQPYNFDRYTNDWDETVFQQLDFSRIPLCKDNLLTILSDKPVFFPKGNFKKILEQAYTAVAKKITKGKRVDVEESDSSQINLVENIEILLDNNADFVIANLRDNKGTTVNSFDEQEKMMEWLDAVPLAELDRYAHAVKSLKLLYQFALKLAEQSAVIPQLIAVDGNQYKIRWIPAVLNPAVKSIRDGVQSILATDILFYKNGNEIYEPIEADKSTALLSLFLNFLINENHGLNYRFSEHEIGHMFFEGAILQFQNYEDKEYPAAIQLWLNRFFIVEKDFIPVLQVDEAGDDKGFWVNMAVHSKTNKLKVPIPINAILEQKKYVSIRMDVLRDLAMLANYFPQINQLVASKGLDDLYFDSEEFVNVLFKIVPTIRLFGISVLLPKSLRKVFRPRMSMQVEASKESGVISKKNSIVNIEEMLSFEWNIALGDTMISQAGFSELVNKFSGIVKLNDQYVFFDENEIKALIKKLENPPTLSGKDLLQIALTEDYEGSRVQLDKQTRKLIDRLLKKEKVALPKGLLATLRPYQRSGYNWLYKNARIGFGSLIADDMGLGKTLQVIATLLKLKEDGELDKHKALIVVPTTLLTNWQKEIQKFAPALRAFVYHGSKRNLEPLREADILITTYGIARSENTLLQKQKWLLLVIDEAQNIKNPGTAQTKAIKKINAPLKIAMSGTPVENRLSEYWSIFDFTNKGYLDSLSHFKKEYARPIEADRDQFKLGKFRSITQPFILRRLKSDKSIIKDLPDKIEKDQFCFLAPKQAAIYQGVVDNTLETIARSAGIERKGLVLKLITALKQVCNHPRQFLKKGPTDVSLSGKMQMLFDLIQQIQSTDEKTLIFTQYREMGEILVQMLEATFNTEVPFLHGGLSRKARDKMVTDFQENRATRIFILSLKAGGTGLNLTAASNVIHYDLWWNPAVEAQATDRAYRIGQKRKVLVHRLITEGTFEEKINKLLQEKKELANLTVSTGEKWIGEFSDTELRELVSLA